MIKTRDAGSLCAGAASCRSRGLGPQRCGWSPPICLAATPAVSGGVGDRGGPLILAVADYDGIRDQ